MLYIIYFQMDKNKRFQEANQTTSIFALLATYVCVNISMYNIVDNIICDNIVSI